MWKAEIVAGDFTVPIRLYSVLESKSVRFRLLHAKDLEPVFQQMVDPSTGQPVPAEEIRRGVEVEPGVYVLITDEEQQELTPPESRTITVERVVKRSAIDQRWFDHPYYLGPDGNTDSYFAFAEALASSDQVAVVQWVMRKSRYNGAIHAASGYLMIQTFRSAEELLKIDPVRVPQNRAPDARELRLAEQLITALKDDFDPAAYQDEYRKQVLELIEMKASGKLVKFPKAKKEKEEPSLLEALEASLGQPRKAAAGA
jgi:DNA end-binding protein Ku